MKILKNGNEKVFKTMCHKCRTDIEYNKGDTFEQTYFTKSLYFWGKEENTRNVIKCPICGELLEVHYNN